MSKTVVLVGHCNPDSNYLKVAIAKVDKAMIVHRANNDAELQALLARGADLLLINRKLEPGFAKGEMGIDVIRRVRGLHPKVKTMLVSNYPEAQAEAVQAGALPGFGKRELGSTRVTEVIRQSLIGG